MKKFIILIIIILACICCVFYMYKSSEFNIRETKQQNGIFEKYYQQEIYGTEIATIISKARELNRKNNVEIDDKNLYIENTTNSIKIYIKMLDSDTTYPMEIFANKGIANFVEYYSAIQFKCVDIKYHDKTNLIKSLMFEQITV